jgi:hypothetical protein
MELQEHTKLENPIQTTHFFQGGPMDGQSHGATEHYEMMVDKTMVCINNANYLYKGGGNFLFTGMTHKAVFAEPTFLQKLKERFLRWLLT